MGKVSVELLAVNELLAKNLNIPNYQRPYVWEEKQVLQLLDDIWENWNFTQNGTALLTTWDTHFLIKWDSYLRRQPYSQSTRARCPS